MPYTKYSDLGEIVMSVNIKGNGLKVLERRYLERDEAGNFKEDVSGLFRRVAKAVAAADKPYVTEDELKKIEDEFYDMMTNLEFLPNSPTLMNAGRPLGQLSACFVLPIIDTMNDIFETVKNAALIHKSGGGTGFSFSRLRAKGSSVNSTGGIASGPVSFMKVFNAATEAVKQGGTRRGANMAILRIDHPDILEFISCKKDTTEITNFNISVGITEKFMKAVEKGENYDLINPNDKSVARTLSAREVYEYIIDMAWNNGEPGIIFLDRLNECNVTPKLGEIESTNPCGEQPLLPYEACNLGSINLKIMLKENGSESEVDYDKLSETVKKAVRFLDNVIDVNKYPIPEIDRMTRSTRKIGLGIMGWADMLCKLNIPYNSQEALHLGGKIMSFIQEEAKKQSIKLAEIKGAFPEYNKSIYKAKGIKIRNATTTTIAPTGTLSIIADVSSGIEPIFAISYIRNVMDNDELVEVNENFKKVAVERGFYSDNLMKRIAAKGTVHGFPEVPDDVQKIFVTAHDVSPEYHIKMQGVFQDYTDNAVSKTVNLPCEATREDVKAVYNLAYELGCKGVTIYRDGSRDMQVLNIGSVKGKEDGPNKTDNSVDGFKTSGNGISPRPRPDVTRGFTEKVKIGCGTIFITVNYDEDGICEVFTNLGRAGGCPSQSEATSRLISIALRSGVDGKSIVDQLKGIRCHSTIRQKGLKVLSCPDAIGKVVEKVMKIQNGNNNFNTDISIADKILNTPACSSDSLEGCNSTDCSLGNECGQVKVEKKDNDPDGFYVTGMKFCPECGNKLSNEGGCVVCHNCGFSKCG